MKSRCTMAKLQTSKKEAKKKGMNLPNKITCVRLVLSVIVLLILLFPWRDVNVEWPVYSTVSYTHLTLPTKA